jgi:hypothetical protein
VPAAISEKGPHWCEKLDCYHKGWGLPLSGQHSVPGDHPADASVCQIPHMDLDEPAAEEHLRGQEEERPLGRSL